MAEVLTRQSQFDNNELYGEIPDLYYDVKNIRQNPDLTKLHLLTGAGYLVKDQIRNFYESLANGVSFEDSISQVEQDVQGFKTEYLVQLPVFPIVLDRVIFEGEERLVGALYGGKPFSEAISSVEREGAVKQATDEIEAKLLGARPGTLIVMTSSEGESGYQNRNGVLEAVNEDDIKNDLANEVIYIDSQTYCYEVQKDGSIRGFTLKSDMDIFQNEELLRRLGVKEERFEKYARPMDRIKQAVLNYAVIDPSEGRTIEDVLSTIVDIKQDEVLFKDINQNPRTAGEARDPLKNPDSLWTLDDTTKALVDRFKKYAWWGMINNSVDPLDLQIALGDVILRLMHEINGGSGSSLASGADKILGAYNPESALSKLLEIPGCAGGGIVDSVTPREAKTENKKRILCCTCPFCQKEVEAEIEGGRISCPKCKKTAKWND